MYLGVITVNSASFSTYEIIAPEQGGQHLAAPFGTSTSRCSDTAGASSFQSYGMSIGHSNFAREKVLGFFRDFGVWRGWYLGLHESQSSLLTSLS